MIDILIGQTDQYINLETGTRFTRTEYYIVSALPKGDPVDFSSIDISTLPPIRIQIRYDQGGNTEFTIRYLLFQMVFESPQEITVSPSGLGSFDIPCSELPLEIVQHALQQKDDATFPFELIITEQFNMHDLNQCLRIEERKDINFGEDLVEVENTARSHVGANLIPIPLKSSVRIIGNLREEIIWRVEAIGIEAHKWHVEINDIGLPFQPSEYRELIERALNQQGDNILRRVGTYLGGRYPITDGRPLPIKVVFDEIPPQQTVRIRYLRRFPEEELFFRTGSEPLDRIILNIHRELVRKGLSVGPDAPIYQKVFAAFLKVRASILTVPGFVDYNEIKKDERTFHQWLHGLLSLDINFGVPTLSEIGTGNGRIDLLIAELPTELKLERRETVTTKEICDSYKQQAADYISRQGSQVGFLVVLDTITARKDPTPPADQDVILEEVTTASGSTVSLICLIIRLPRSPSEFSK